MCTTLNKQKQLIGEQQVQNKLNGKFYLGIRYANERAKVVAYVILESTQPLSSSELVIALGEIVEFINEVTGSTVLVPYFNHNYKEDMVASLDYEDVEYGLQDSTYTAYVGLSPLA